MNSLNSFWVLIFFLSMSIMTQGQDRTHFYDALSKGDTVQINEQLKQATKLSSIDRQAFTGTLMMRKAEYAKGVRAKLDLFKTGGQKLEAAIAKSKSNVEYRFLRLLIQENAPSILNYNDNIQEDAKILKEGYSKLFPETQKAVLDYCLRSKVIKVSDFKN